MYLDVSERFYFPCLSHHKRKRGASDRVSYFIYDRRLINGINNREEGRVSALKMLAL